MGSRPAVVTITSGKGGVGKTNIAANLSICLANIKKRVLLIDADLGLGNLDVLMNLNSRFNLAQVLAGRKNIEDIIQLGPAGVEVICGGSGIEELANINHFQRQRLVDDLERLRRSGGYHCDRHRRRHQPECNQFLYGFGSYDGGDDA